MPSLLTPPPPPMYLRFPHRTVSMSSNYGTKVMISGAIYDCKYHLGLICAAIVNYSTNIINSSGVVEPRTRVSCSTALCTRPADR